MSNYTLFGDYRSGNCYKPVLFMALSSTPYAYRHEDVTVPRTERSDEIQGSSRFGQLPVLIDDGSAMCQSNSILCFLSNRSVLFNFSDYLHRQQVMEWLFWESCNIGKSVSNLRWLTKFSANTAEDILADLRDRAVKDLDRLEQELTSKPFLVNDTPSIADISICAYLYWLKDTGLDTGRWPQIKAWLDRISELPGWFHPDDMPRDSREFA